MRGRSNSQYVRKHIPPTFFGSGSSDDRVGGGKLASSWFSVSTSLIVRFFPFPITNEFTIPTTNNRSHKFAFPLTVSYHDHVPVVSSVAQNLTESMNLTLHFSLFEGSKFPFSAYDDELMIIDKVKCLGPQRHPGGTSVHLGHFRP